MGTGTRSIAGNAVDIFHNGNGQLRLEAVSLPQRVAPLRLAVPKDIEGREGRERHVLRGRKLTDLLENLDRPVEVVESDIGGSLIMCSNSDSI